MTDREQKERGFFQLKGLTQDLQMMFIDAVNKQRFPNLGDREKVWEKHSDMWFDYEGQENR